MKFFCPRYFSMSIRNEIHGDNLSVHVDSRGAIKAPLTLSGVKIAALTTSSVISSLNCFPAKIPIALDSSYKHLSLWLQSSITRQAIIPAASQHLQSKRKKKPFDDLHISKRIFKGSQAWRGNRNVDGFHHYFVTSNYHATFLDQCLCQESFTGMQRLIQNSEHKKKAVSKELGGSNTKEETDLQQKRQRTERSRGNSVLGHHASEKLYR